MRRWPPSPVPSRTWPSSTSASAMPPATSAGARRRPMRPAWPSGAAPAAEPGRPSDDPRMTDDDVSTDPHRLTQLVEAVQVIGSDLSLPDVLRRIVQAAVDLVGARYGALSVL